MNIEGKTIWQVAAGNGNNTHYAKQCLEQNAVMIGPGHYGAWPECEQPMRADGLTARNVGMVRRFATEMKAGHLVVLRVGTKEVYGVGALVSTYDWSEKFANVQDWDLQHFWRVHWLWHQNGEPKTFSAYALNLGNRVQYLNPNALEVRRWLTSLSVNE